MKKNKQKMHVKIGDTVKVIAGDDKGKIGKITKILHKQSKIVIEGVNICFKHLKPRQENQSGEIKQYELPIHSSNVSLINSSE